MSLHFLNISVAIQQKLKSSQSTSNGTRSSYLPKTIIQKSHDTVPLRKKLPEQSFNWHQPQDLASLSSCNAAEFEQKDTFHYLAFCYFVHIGRLTGTYGRDNGELSNAGIVEQR